MFKISYLHIPTKKLITLPKAYEVFEKPIIKKNLKEIKPFNNYNKNTANTLNINVDVRTEELYLTFFDKEDCERKEYLLSDLKPLLTVEIDGVELRSLTVRHSKEYPKVYQLLYFDGKAWRVHEKYTDGPLSDNFLSYVVENNLYFFESNPAKYSKLLWNCSEEEGWEKIFKLLEIEK